MLAIRCCDRFMSSGKDGSRLLVLTEPVTLDLGQLNARGVIGSDQNDVIDGSVMS